VLVHDRCKVFSAPALTRQQHDRSRQGCERGGWRSFAAEPELSSRLLVLRVGPPALLSAAAPVAPDCFFSWGRRGATPARLFAPPSLGDRRELLRHGLRSVGAVIENSGARSRDYSVLKAPQGGWITHHIGIVKLAFVGLCRSLLGSRLNCHRERLCAHASTTERLRWCPGFVMPKNTNALIRNKKVSGARNAY
jgi:hypothetical protein